MNTAYEGIELRKFLRGETGRELLQSFPLVEAHIESVSILKILRQHCIRILPEVEENLGVKITFGAFGSLGRLEYVHGHSDLDPIIIVRPDDNELPIDNDIRSRVITPLAKACPWLKMDDRSLVITKRWNDISACELKYPIYTEDAITTGDDALTIQRRWQLLLETRPLYNGEFLNRIRNRITPQSVKTKPLDGSPQPLPEVDFRLLVEMAPEFYSAFENPDFLFKSAYKYWKTRFLREFYAFSTNIAFVLGWYCQKHEEALDSDYFLASTAIKIMRSTRFAQELEIEAKADTSLCRLYHNKSEEILRKWNLSTDPLVLYGRDYSMPPARLLHGLLGAVLSRFANCWAKLYDEEIKTKLESIPKAQCNFDATFLPTKHDPEVANIVKELMALRKSYLKYMGATAEFIDCVFPKGRVWSYHTVPAWLGDALKPFYTRKSE